MTFIASVVAKEGVAIIADSLVTEVRRVADFGDFIKYIESVKAKGDDGIKLEYGEIAKLFRKKPSHTKDYEDKLYQYDRYTVITTAGSASINGKRIKKLVKEAIKTLKPQSIGYGKTSIAKKVEDLKGFITEEIKKYLNVNPLISSTVLLITSYNKTSGKTSIYKMQVVETNKKSLEVPDFEFVHVELLPENNTVVCEGQNRLSGKLLFGDFDLVFEIVPAVIKRLVKDFKIDEALITEDYIATVYKDPSILTRQIFDDMKIFKLTELSLQQAVDLASLLMRIEINMQKYTENIPTVGGVIKLAIINEKGFSYISGDDIKSENFNH